MSTPDQRTGEATRAELGHFGTSRPFAREGRRETAKVRG
jgi:hypothetical protein